MVNETGGHTARELRRRHMHERQAVVFGVLIAALALIGVGAVAVFSGAIKSPVDRAIASPAPTDTALLTSPACLPKGTRPVAFSKVHVNVYNASRKSGVARATADALAHRGFLIAAVGNSTVDIAAPRIVYGTKGLASAYTLYAHIPDARLTLDARRTADVDLVLGSSYAGLRAEKDVKLSAKKAMTSVPQCVAVTKITPLKVGSSVPKTNGKTDSAS